MTTHGCLVFLSQSKLRGKAQYVFVFEETTHNRLAFQSAPCHSEPTSIQELRRIHRRRTFLFLPGRRLMKTSMCVATTMNTIVVIEDQATKQTYDGEPFPMGTALNIQCLCGARIHPIVGAWCPQCGAKVVQIREFN
jgi:hypothetical protein